MEMRNESENKKWRGKSFYDWCKSDPEDDRKICYSIRGGWLGKGKVERFSSEDNVSYEMMLNIRRSTIRSIELGSDNAWHVDLKY